MNRLELEHVLRASADITREHSFVVIGSQAVLLAFPDAPEELLVSRELDLYPAMAPEKAELIEGAIGALSAFDETFGYYADGVGPETAVMPPDWMDHAKLHYIGELTVICPEVHDLALSKAVAAREKDADFVRGLLRHRMVEPSRLLARALQLEPSRCEPGRVHTWLQRRIEEASAAS
jgi:hypothetical protein